jgi:hypothetical protein
VIGGNTALAGLLGVDGTDGIADCDNNEFVIDCIRCNGEAAELKSSTELISPLLLLLSEEPFCAVPDGGVDENALL